MDTNKVAIKLTEATKINTTVDWNIHKSSRANIRRVIKRLLKKYDYPPDKRIQVITVIMRLVEKMVGNLYDEL